MIREITTIEDPNTVFELARRRQEVEAEFARNVYNVFNQGQALAKLQKVAGGLLRLMVEGPVNAFDASISDEPFLRVYDKVPKNLAGFTMWQSPLLLRRLDATDCADLIRLAGAWVERGGFGGGARAHMPSRTHPNVADQVKGSYRVGGADVWGPQIRVRRDGWELEPHLVPYMRDPNASFTGMAGVRGKHGKKGSKRATGSSSVLKLDRLFGLIVACDISGTTTDCMFALEQLGGEFGLTAAYYMLPLGTIVHNMHHSVLEVALATSLNKEMDYHIGFFESLKPVRCQAFPAELAGLQGAIHRADAQMRHGGPHHEGFHHLRYYQGDRPKGVFHITGAQLMALRNSPISQAVEMDDRAQCMGEFPQRFEVVQLLESAGFRLQHPPALAERMAA